MDEPRQRKVTSRYGKHDDHVNMSDFDSSNSDFDLDESGRKKRKKRGGRSRHVDDELHRANIIYNRAECFKVEKNLLVYGSVDCSLFICKIH